MPFLRRRDKSHSEHNIRQHVKGDSNDAPPVPPVPPVPRSSETSESAGSVFPDSQDDEPTPRPFSTDDATHTLGHPQDKSANTSGLHTADAHEDSQKHRRFSMLRFRNASDSQLSLRAKQHAEAAPPVPKPPQIITTAPTGESAKPKKKSSHAGFTGKLRLSSDIPRESPFHRPRSSKKSRKSFQEDAPRPSLATLQEPGTPRSSLQSSSTPEPSGLTAMQQQASESSRSEDGSADQMSQTSPRTTPTRNSSRSPFFKLRRGKKNPAPLFDLSHLPRKDGNNPSVSSSTSLGNGPFNRPSSSYDGGTPRRSRDGPENGQRPGHSLILLRTGSRSGHSSPTRTTTLLRGRSSTMSSAAGRDSTRVSTDEHLMPPTTWTSSAASRKSVGDLLGLTRLRQNSDLSRQNSFGPGTPMSSASKSNSLQIARESIALPERKEDESPGKYLARVEEVMARGLIGAVLSKGVDSFSASVLRSYMRSFSFFGDPMDMSIRKLLMVSELPKETQHIDRFLQAFANRYHECNPGIFSSPDQAYFIAFSLLILHTDVFNKNNKHKMQKPDYLKNTRGEGVDDDVLECFYDNISYTPFIHVEDDFDVNLDGATAAKSKKSQLVGSSGQDPAKRAVKEPVDPYTLIIDNNLDALRPNLKDAMFLENHYNYLGTASELNLRDLQKTFFRTGVLQIVSARSRPDAFMSDKTSLNPADALPGIVDIKVTKVGLLWRKEAKKRKTRSPWQEWGAILTGAQLYFFRNVSWIKNLMHQYESHVKAGNDGIPIIFNPPLEQFKPDSLMSTHGAVALLDTNYKRHKNAFVYVRQGGLDEVLLADNEHELNDWVAKLNYAAAFRTSGVKMRGVAGGFDEHGRRVLRRNDTSESTQLVQTPTGPVSIVRGRIDRQMVEDIQIARRDFMRQKIEEAEVKLEVAQKRLDDQLRNARHLLILAPIQPKTREQLLSSAAKMAAQLKWTRIEMGKERCHKDILVQDLEEDSHDSSYAPTQTKKRTESQRTGSPTPARTDSKATRNTVASDKSFRTPKDHYALGTIPISNIAHDVETSLDEVLYATPDGATPSNRDSQEILPHKPEGTRKPSDTSITKSPRLFSSGSPSSFVAKEMEQRPDSSRSDRGQDEIDAEERQFLKQAGLLESRHGHHAAEKIPSSASAESERGGALDREKLDRNKIRRSLHRTLRDGAGHLSHHRSKRGKDGPVSGVEEGAETKLARGTGSFIVHGKKASVVRLGTELQNMSQDEKIISRKSGGFAEPAPPSPFSPGIIEDDFVSAASVPVESTEQSGRRGSAASASTATARSFRDLHRKYSTAQAARSVSSSGGKLVVPSDGESEVAVSFSDGQRSPLPPIETASHDEEEDVFLPVSSSPEKGQTRRADELMAHEAYNPNDVEHDSSDDSEYDDEDPERIGTDDAENYGRQGQHEDRKERKFSHPAEPVNV